MRSMNDVALKDQRVLIRQDFNVPIQEGVILDDTRLRAALPGIHHALSQGAAVILLSHLGRPQEGVFEGRYSLAPVAHHLGQLLGRSVRFVSDWIDGFSIAPGEVALCENVRFLSGEKANDPQLARRMAALAEVCVFEAFAAAHRSEASTVGLAECALSAVAGPLLFQEVETLDRLIERPSRPLMAIVGGSKISTKLGLLKHLFSWADVVAVGGGIANTLLAASRCNTQDSFIEASMLQEAQELLLLAYEKDVQLILPSDVLVTSDSFDRIEHVVPREVGDLRRGEKIVDLGKNTLHELREAILSSRTIVWNGPLGLFEQPLACVGTLFIAHSIAQHVSCYSVAGGGETIAALNQAGVFENFSYVSTAGGAFLEYLEGRSLPLIRVLSARGSRH